MCVTRVVNNKKTKIKENNNDLDSKFKPLSAIQENKTENNKYKKRTEMENIIYSPDVNKTKKNKVYFKDDLDNIILFKSPNPNKQKIATFNKHEKRKKKKKTKIGKKKWKK